MIFRIKGKRVISPSSRDDPLQKSRDKNLPIGLIDNKHSIAAISRNKNDHPTILFAPRKMMAKLLSMSKWTP